MSGHADADDVLAQFAGLMDFQSAKKRESATAGDSESAAEVLGSDDVLENPFGSSIDAKSVRTTQTQSHANILVTKAMASTAGTDEATMAQLEIKTRNRYKIPPNVILPSKLMAEIKAVWALRSGPGGMAGMWQAMDVMKAEIDVAVNADITKAIDAVKGCTYYTSLFPALTSLAKLTTHAGLISWSDVFEHVDSCLDSTGQISAHMSSRADSLCGLLKSLLETALKNGTVQQPEIATVFTPWLCTAMKPRILQHKSASDVVTFIAKEQNDFKEFLYDIPKDEKASLTGKALEQLDAAGESGKIEASKKTKAPRTYCQLILEKIREIWHSPSPKERYAKMKSSLDAAGKKSKIHRAIHPLLDVLHDLSNDLHEKKTGELIDRLWEDQMKDALKPVALVVLNPGVKTFSLGDINLEMHLQHLVKPLVQRQLCVSQYCQSAPTVLKQLEQQGHNCFDAFAMVDALRSLCSLPFPASVAFTAVEVIVTFGLRDLNSVMSTSALRLFRQGLQQIHDEGDPETLANLLELKTNAEGDGEEGDSDERVGNLGKKDTDSNSPSNDKGSGDGLKKFQAKENQHGVKSDAFGSSSFNTTTNFKPEQNPLSGSLKNAEPKDAWPSSLPIEKGMFNGGLNHSPSSVIPEEGKDGDESMGQIGNAMAGPMSHGGATNTIFSSVVANVSGNGNANADAGKRKRTDDDHDEHEEPSAKKSKKTESKKKPLAMKRKMASVKRKGEKGRAIPEGDGELNIDDTQDSECGPDDINHTVHVLLEEAMKDFRDQSVEAVNAPAQNVVDVVARGLAKQQGLNCVSAQTNANGPSSIFGKDRPTFANDAKGNSHGNRVTNPNGKKQGEKSIAASSVAGVMDNWLENDELEIPEDFYDSEKHNVIFGKSSDMPNLLRVFEIAKCNSPGGPMATLNAWWNKKKTDLETQAKAKAAPKSKAKGAKAKAKARTAQQSAIIANSATPLNLLLLRAVCNGAAAIIALASRPLPAEPGKAVKTYRVPAKYTEAATTLRTIGDDICKQAAGSPAPVKRYLASYVQIAAKVNSIAQLVFYFLVPDAEKQSQKCIDHIAAESDIHTMRKIYGEMVKTPYYHLKDLYPAYFVAIEKSIDENAAKTRREQFLDNQEAMEDINDDGERTC